MTISCDFCALRNTSKPTSIVGNGTPASCNQSALVAALLKGGINIFNCGSGHNITININVSLQISSINDTIIDGAGIATLNGLWRTRILKFDSGDFLYSTPTLTVQRLRLSNGALGILGSGLIISNSHFETNTATGNGGNLGNGGNGGAISFDGLGRNNTICGTRFTGNQANKFDGPFFRVSYNVSEKHIFDNVLADSNFISINGNGLAGGFYIQGGTVTIRNGTIADNSATGAGGIFFVNDKSVTLNNVNH
ncbi:unnamed protein product [Rotaria magnacalcarata]|uniref:Polymorphic outer membrane protein n=2 Tax=Rotaria magnacalcarata TaxID=392030 RepID=A0A815IX16_9BILA|nr:unnamed protein product [Rotaria magnacalcarata]